MMIWLRVCANCSCSLPPVDLLCKSCWRVLEKHIFTQYQEQRRHLAPFPVRYLWEWRETESLVGELIYSMKNATLPEAHQRLVDFWLQSYPFLISLKKPCVIVYPTKNLASEDHASFLAHALGKRLEIPAHPLLIAPTSDFYRSLGRDERYRRRKIVGDLKISGKEIIFVDDVFTTGATATRAWEFLGQPARFQVCVLAYRGFGLHFAVNGSM
jgi:predicted amidophosphoribosyltransferase